MVVYLDYNATTPIAEEVQATICSTMKNIWGNPSSLYDAGREAKSVVEDARRKVAEMIGSAPHEIIFTSGGTESNYMAIMTAIHNFHQENLNNSCDTKSEIPHIITSNIEHDSIKLPLERLAEEGKIEVSFVPVSKIFGTISPDDIANEVKPNTCLVSIMLANNETGVIQPVENIQYLLNGFAFDGQKKRKHSILLHTDAAQALGKIQVDVDSLSVDYLTIVGHKFYGPRIGALYFRQGKPIYPLFYGGGQEKKLRPGTENTCMIAGLGKAAELVTLNLPKFSAHMLSMRDYFEKLLQGAFLQNIVFNTHDKAPRLPNTSSVAFTFPYLTGDSLLNEAKDVYASTGAACHAEEKYSQVLVNSGVCKNLSSKTVRFSMGRDTVQSELEESIKYLQKAVRRLRRL